MKWFIVIHIDIENGKNITMKSLLYEIDLLFSALNRVKQIETNMV